MNRISHFRVALNLIIKYEAKYKVFIMKISFHSYADKSTFLMKRFALSLAFIMRLTSTQKCLFESENCIHE